MTAAMARQLLLIEVRRSEPAFCFEGSGLQTHQGRDKSVAALLFRGLQRQRCINGRISRSARDGHHTPIHTTKRLSITL